jgi:para-nitrobenzyl esterase
MVPDTTTGSEDCLFLNIWSHDDDVIRPVIVFNHGGAANGVGGSGATVDGANLAVEGDIIVVTLNRRLGVLGHLAIDELIQENPRSTAGNYATLDVIAALSWLNDNIGAFNGDPDRIMLAGQSAGGAISCSVLASPDAMGLFNSAALQSPGCRRWQVLNDQVGIPTDDEYAAVEHRELVTFFGCDASADVLACLRDLPVEDLVLAQDQVFADFGTVIDGVVVTDTARNSLASEVAGNVPVIIGSNADEATNIFGPNPVADDAEYQQVLDFIFGPPLSDDLYALYPTASYSSASEAFLTLFSDLLFNCVAEELANSAEGGAPAYFYHFARGFDNGGSAGLGAFHTIDVAHLFGSFDVWGYTPDAQALDISTAMRSAWSGLARDSTAAPPYLPGGASSWPAYAEAARQIVQFGDVIEIVNEHRAGRCPALTALLDSR